MHPYIRHEHARGHGYHDRGGGGDHHSLLHQTSSGHVQVQFLQFVSHSSARRKQIDRYFQLSPLNYAPIISKKYVLDHLQAT